MMTRNGKLTDLKGFNRPSAKLLIIFSVSEEGDRFIWNHPAGHICSEVSAGLV